MGTVPYLEAAAIRERLGPRAAADALEAALRAGNDPSAGVPRAIIAVNNGELLVMPAEVPGAVGVKVMTVAPANTARGLARIQGVYVLFDPDTLGPRAVLDGIELTALRTPAVSLLAIRGRLRATEAPLRMVVAGTGIQAVRHVETTIAVIADVRPVESVTYLSRHPEDAVVPSTSGITTAVAGYETTAAHAALAAADLVVCATSSAEPLFDGRVLRAGVTVVAVGSHDPNRRELDDHLMGSAGLVVVEDIATALREAGDIVQAIRSGALNMKSLIPLERVVKDRKIMLTDQTVVFKSSGMAWQDAVIAGAVLDGPAS